MAAAEKPEKPSRPARPYSKGYLRLALVTIPLQIHTATDAASNVRLNQIHKPSGQRITYTVTAGGNEIDKNDVVKAYRLPKTLMSRWRPRKWMQSSSRRSTRPISSGRTILPRKVIGSSTPCWRKNDA
jgi:hypothetical protein